MLESVVAGAAEDVVAASAEAPAAVAVAPPVASVDAAVAVGVVLDAFGAGAFDPEVSDVATADPLVSAEVELAVVSELDPLVSVGALFVVDELDASAAGVVVDDVSAVGVDVGVGVGVVGVGVGVDAVSVGDVFDDGEGAGYCGCAAVGGAAVLVSVGVAAALPPPLGVDDGAATGVCVAGGSATGMPIESETAGTFANGSLDVCDVDDEDVGAT